MSERVWENVKIEQSGHVWNVWAREDRDCEWVLVEGYPKLADAEQLADELDNDDDKREELIDTALEEEEEEAEEEEEDEE